VRVRRACGPLGACGAGDGPQMAEASSYNIAKFVFGHSTDPTIFAAEEIEREGEGGEEIRI